MKISLKSIRYLLLGIGLVGFILPVQGQPREGRPGVVDRLPPNASEDVRAEAQRLRAELQAVHAVLRESRSEVLESLGEDATREARRAALNDWNAEYADELEQAAALADELRELLQENRPERPDRPVISEEVKALQEAIRAQRAALNESRQAAIEGLTDPAEIRAALETWRQENAAAMDALKEEMDGLRDLIRETRPERPERPVAPGSRERREHFRDTAMQMRDARKEMAEELRLAPDAAARQEIIRQYREQQRDLMQERKELRRQQREDGDTVGGDRRSDD